MGLGIARNDPAERQREMIERVLRERFENDTDQRARVARALRRLLDLDDDQQLMERGELFSAWRALFERLAADGPVVLMPRPPTTPSGRVGLLRSSTV